MRSDLPTSKSRVASRTLRFKVRGRSADLATRDAPFLAGCGNLTLLYCTDTSQGNSMRRVVVRRSSVHGKGVFAMRSLLSGERVLEYKGEITAWRDAVRRHRREGVEGHTFLFGLSDGRVIDGSCGGNSSRWLNHSCAPNCEAIEDGGRIFIHAIRTIEAGEELFIEYLLATDDPLDENLRAQYACRCAAASCRQSMLAAAA
jgi:SET domain-containing protein